MPSSLEVDTVDHQCYLAMWARSHLQCNKLLYHCKKLYVCTVQGWQQQACNISAWWNNAIVTTCSQPFLQSLFRTHLVDKLLDVYVYTIHQSEAWWWTVEITVNMSSSTSCIIPRTLFHSNKCSQTFFTYNYFNSLSWDIFHFLRICILQTQSKVKTWCHTV